MKLVTLLCLIGSSLAAELIDGIQIDFPPSNREWTPLIEHEKLKIYTHREGDALELFALASAPSDEEIEWEREEMIKALFPNHRHAYKTGELCGLTEWEFHDGKVDLMHGLAREIDEGEKTYLLFYLTTALKSEINTHLWAQILNQASRKE
jgi:hypothetical protein